MYVLRVLHLSVSLRLMVSSEGSRLTLVRVRKSCFHVGTCVVEQCGIVVPWQRYMVERRCHV